MATVASATSTYNPIASIDRNQEATIYVGNLDERCTDDILWELFLQVGPVVHVYIPRDRIAHTQSGYGFVEFQSEVDAEYTVKIMNGIKLYGKALKVNKASQDKQVFDIGANLYIANLDPSVDERMLTECFSSFGRVLQVRLGRDLDTGVPKGFAFVNFDSFEVADAAVEAMNGQFLANRPITVAYAYKKDGRPGERHGTVAERLLAEQAKKNSVAIGAIPGPTQQVPSAVTASMTATAQAFLMQQQQWAAMYGGMQSPYPGYPYPVQQQQQQQYQSFVNQSQHKNQ